jgi:hypothetical protein
MILGMLFRLRSSNFSRKTHLANSKSPRYDFGRVGGIFVLAHVATEH